MPAVGLLQSLYLPGAESRFRPIADNGIWPTACMKTSGSADPVQPAARYGCGFLRDANAICRFPGLEI